MINDRTGGILFVFDTHCNNKSLITEKIRRGKVNFAEEYGTEDFFIHRNKYYKQANNTT